MSFAVMPLDEWKNIVNAVKRKTGKTDPLLCTQVATEIDSITIKNDERTIFGDYVQGTIYEVTAEDLIGVTSISPYAFYYRPITSIEFPDTVTEIGKDAFTYSKLKSVKLPDSMTSLTNGFYRCYDLESVDLNNITYLGSYCLSESTSLTSIDISNITSADKGAFQNSGLTHITIPGTLNTVSQSFCGRCKSLASVRMENGVSKINSYAFTDCTALMEIVCLSTNPPVLDSTSLNNVPADCVIKVPAASLEAYKTATNWSERADYIIAYEE